MDPSSPSVCPPACCAAARVLGASPSLPPLDPTWGGAEEEVAPRRNYQIQQFGGGSQWPTSTAS
eukprot:15444153-Alexandrium_andersonii.AAC.1